jgi:hypothetical protein
MTVFLHTSFTTAKELLISYSHLDFSLALLSFPLPSHPCFILAQNEKEENERTKIAVGMQSKLLTLGLGKKSMQGEVTANKIFPLCH